VAHVFFKGSPNFALSVFAFAVEGWLFYSAVNSVTPQIVLNLGFQTNAWKISIRQLSYNLVTLFVSIPITYVGSPIQKNRFRKLTTNLQVICNEIQGFEVSVDSDLCHLPRGVSAGHYVTLSLPFHPYVGTH
jgi:hypothetical protein